MLQNDTRRFRFLKHPAEPLLSTRKYNENPLNFYQMTRLPVFLVYFFHIFPF